MTSERKSYRGQSVLTPGQRSLLRGVLALSAFLVANSLYLSSVRLLDKVPALAAPEGTLPAFLQVMILTHIGAGCLLLVPALWFALWHLSRVWRRHHGSAVWTGVLVLACAAALAFSGPYIMSQAQSRQNRGMFWTHVGAAVLVLLAYAVHRLVSAYRPTPRTLAKAVLVIGALYGAALAIHISTRPPPPAVADGPAPPSAPRSPALTPPPADPFIPFQAIGDVPAGRLFFPAAATTTTLAALPAEVLTNRDLPDPEILAADMKSHSFLHRDTVGAATCVRCHPDVVEQWSASAHRFSSFNNPFYRKTIETMREREGFTRSKWCSSCHDPVLMLPGDMDRPIDAASGHAQAGLTCLSCHQIDRLHSQTGNGAYNIPDTQPEPYLFSESKGWAGRLLHDTIVKSRPDVHKQQLLKPFFRTGEFCSACHKVSLDVPVNGYRWFRGQNEYDNWYDSGVNHAAARTFYLPPNKKVCQDCHMPFEPAPKGDVSARGGMVRSHRFVAVNTALPHLRGDREMIRRTEEFLQEGKLRIDVFALRAGGARGDEGEAILAVDRAEPTLVPGRSVEFHVVVRNLGVGHTFPGGTNDSNEGWIDFQVSDEEGNVLLTSGGVGKDGHLDPRAHKYHVIIVDENSDPIHTRIPTTFRAAVYTRVIAPSTSDLARYRVTVPAGLAGTKLRVKADLRWRKFSRAYTEFVFQGKGVPDLPITTIASSERTLAIEANPHPPPEVADGGPPPDWTRFNDYGIGLLLQGDTRAAARAFEEVARIVPERPDGPRNLARTALADGNLAEAKVHLEACERVAPGDPQTALFWAEYQQRSGSYDLAVRAYGRVLDYFPQDRAARFQLGRTLFLMERFPEAVAELLKVHAIDPEHREAHYHRMLCYRALGNAVAAAEAEKAYLKYQIDETAQEFTRNFRLKYPEANFEAQRIHVHE